MPRLAAIKNDGAGGTSDSTVPTYTPPRGPRPPPGSTPAATASTASSRDTLSASSKSSCTRGRSSPPRSGRWPTPREHASASTTCRSPIPAAARRLDGLRDDDARVTARTASASLRGAVPAAVHSRPKILAWAPGLRFRPARELGDRTGAMTGWRERVIAVDRATRPVCEVCWRPIRSTSSSACWRRPTGCSTSTTATWIPSDPLYD